MGAFALFAALAAAGVVALIVVLCIIGVIFYLAAMIGVVVVQLVTGAFTTVDEPEPKKVGQLIALGLISVPSVWWQIHAHATYGAAQNAPDAGFIAWSLTVITLPLAIACPIMFLFRLYSPASDEWKLGSWGRSMFK